LTPASVRSGTLSLDLAGTASYDALDVSQFAILSGTLQIEFVGGFVPALGDHFTVLTYLAHSGTFADIVGADYAPGRSLIPVFGPTSLMLFANVPGDANYDGFVNGADFTLWADNYTGLPGGPQSVPEPCAAQGLRIKTGVF